MARVAIVGAARAAGAGMHKSAAATFARGHFADVFIEDARSGRMEVSGGHVENVTSGRIRGVGFRGFSGTQSIYAYTNELSLTPRSRRRR